MQDQYYNVRGEAFVIPRVEERETNQETCARRTKFVRSKPLPARQPRPASAPSALSLIQQAIAQEPTGLMVISDGPLVEVNAADAVNGPATPVEPAPPANTTCTGIVPLPSDTTTTGFADADAEGGLFETSSTSPRRTKMLRFTCLANGCSAVNVKPISPEAFNRGTVFAQCARCKKWHLITDHLSLWDQTRRPVYRNGKRVKPMTLEEVPEALRPELEDVDFFNVGGGRVGGWWPEKE